MHSECEEQHTNGKLQIIFESSQSIIEKQNLHKLIDLISDIIHNSYINPSDIKRLLVKGWDSAVERFLDDGLLDSSEEQSLSEFKEFFNLSSSDLDTNGSLTKTKKAILLRELINGKIDELTVIKEQLPINFQKHEKVIWVFNNSEYIEDKVRRQYVGRSGGVSIRIMKGVYYRTSTFKGYPIEHTERTHIDTGRVVITDKNFYFAGSSKGLRLPYTKILSFAPFSNGIGIIRDSVNAKQQFFITGDGWFTFNLVKNLSQY
ncbi:hypothetical protein G3N56_01360 [Desulfovibrio sulfodismutans]|uniref:Uncharacterized protein n=1 Tax=Desulfolutivibrio sulfodismutans TaxID=63561 RepID=A0A7K3NGR7_9BACT|nr:hypothetical protein [Desulfolutivibrio sulfodismutans]NDY55391.1 hypothetical protein [Desulfolutivibrio sulfodismutans]QLA12233.1 hypothetical protein GD606_08080 [Desulfolutivibrio sulfodismutans DSM 3696]